VKVQVVGDPDDSDDSDDAAGETCMEFTIIAPPSEGIDMVGGGEDDSRLIDE
jgi:hypothetical protein